MHKVSELKGHFLDAAVALALHPEFFSGPFAVPGPIGVTHFNGEVFKPSALWECGGPIIERERIGVFWHHANARWQADTAGNGEVQVFGAHGATALIAAMRAFVASKLGEEVDL